MPWSRSSARQLILATTPVKVKEEEEDLGLGPTTPVKEEDLGSSAADPTTPVREEDLVRLYQGQ